MSTASRPPPSKRSRPNLGSALKARVPTPEPAPDFDKGVQYWDAVEASVDGVLGGFGTGPVPHIESLSSRLLLHSILPLSPRATPLTPQPSRPTDHRMTALDVGAGIGRVTRDTLLPLFDDVVLVEPVDKFIQEAKKQSKGWRDLSGPGAGHGAGAGKRVWFVKGGLQTLDPAYPARGGEDLGVESAGGMEQDWDRDEKVVYDCIWCQWCLGHLSHSQLVDFLKRARAALRPDGYIVVKENCCEDDNGAPREFLDELDSSLTRSDGRWLEAFKDAGLKVIKDEAQVGMPEELFVVKSYVMV